MTKPKAAGAKPAAPKKPAASVKRSARAPAVSEAKHQHDAAPLWLDQVEGDGPTRHAFRSCQIAGCTVRVELGDFEA